jgi:hypothetical protein
MFRQDLRLPAYWLTTDPLFNFIAKVLYIILNMMVWFFEFFSWILLCSASTLCYSSDRASHNFCWSIESQPLDHSSDICSHHCGSFSLERCCPYWSLNWEAFCDAMNAADIQAIMLRHVIWCASICVHLLFHT